MLKHTASIALLMAFSTSIASVQDSKAGQMGLIEPWARATIGQSKVGAVYVTIVNHDQDSDRLVAVATPVAKKAHLHTHKMEGGVMKMRPVEAIEIKGWASTILKPGGSHVMLMGLRAPLKVGEAFPMTFTFEKAGRTEVQIHVATTTAMKPGDKGHGYQAGHMGNATKDCRLPIRLSEEAEAKPGGAGHATGQSGAGHHRMVHKGPAKAVAGAHMVHEPQFGGAFFMAPNQINHLEAVYSDDCGFRLALFNVATEPISVDRFRAFIKIVPESDQEAELIRFLEPTADQTILATEVKPKPAKPFMLELFLKFPDQEEPELFTMPMH